MDEKSGRKVGEKNKTMVDEGMNVEGWVKGLDGKGVEGRVG